jgi:membrane protein implicated in regulation of membrane protease activity
VTETSSLIRFHRVLITAGIVFCGGFAAWSFATASRVGRPALWLLGAVFAILTIALGVYLWNLRRVLGYREEQSSRR